MKTVDTYGQFEDAITKAGEETKNLARLIRNLIIDVYPDVVELPWPVQGITGYGIGPKKMSEHFCYIAAFPSHINLGFNYGADLPDPDQLLEGTGKKFRHIKIDHKEIIRLDAVRPLIEEAINERKKALNKDPKK